MSDDGTKCVFQFFLAMNVYVPGEGSRTLTYQDGVGEGECLFHMTVTLGPKQSAAQKSLATLQIGDLLSVAKG